MKLYERAEQMGIDEDQTVYRLTYADAIEVVRAKLSKEQIAKMSNTELKELIEAVARSFHHVNWQDCGEVGLLMHKYSGVKLEEELTQNA